MSKRISPKSRKVYHHNDTHEDYELTALLLYIGQTLSYFRENQFLTQTRVAKLLNIPQCHVSYLETGALDMKMSTFLKLCWFLRCAPRQLMPDENGLTRATRAMGGFKAKRKGRSLLR